MATRRNSQSSASKRRTSSRRSTRRNDGPRAQQQVPGQLNQYQDYGGAAQVAPLLAMMKARIGQQSQLQPFGGGQLQQLTKPGAPVRPPPPFDEAPNVPGIQPMPMPYPGPIGGFPGPQGVGPQPNPQNRNGNPIAPLGADWGWRNLSDAQRQRIRNRGGHWGGPEGGRPNPVQPPVQGGPPGGYPGPQVGPGGPRWVRGA